MFERYKCDFVYHQDHRIELTEVIVTDRTEAYEWLDETFLELHHEPGSGPDEVRLRKDDKLLAVWGTHLDAVSG